MNEFNSLQLGMNHGKYETLDGILLLHSLLMVETIDITGNFPHPFRRNGPLTLVDNSASLEPMAPPVGYSRQFHTVEFQ